MIFQAAEHGDWAARAAGLVAPDIALAFGGGRGLARGQLHPRAVGLYNAVHRFWGPLGLIAIALTGALSFGWLVLGLAWLTHIALDRSCGYGLRDARGFQRGCSLRRQARDRGAADRRGVRALRRSDGGGRPAPHGHRRRLSRIPARDSGALPAHDRASATTRGSARGSRGPRRPVAPTRGRRRPGSRPRRLGLRPPVGIGHRRRRAHRAGVPRRCRARGRRRPSPTSACAEAAARSRARRELAQAVVAQTALVRGCELGASLVIELDFAAPAAPRLGGAAEARLAARAARRGGRAG